MWKLKRKSNKQERKQPQPPVPEKVIETHQLTDSTQRLTEATKELADATERLNQARRETPPPVPLPPPVSAPKSFQRKSKGEDESTAEGDDKLPVSTRLLTAFTAVVVLGISLVIAAVVVATQIGFYRSALAVQTVDLSGLGLDFALDLPTFTPIASEGVVWACTLMAVVLVLLNRPSGLWTKSMWFFSIIQATVNAWHSFHGEGDVLGAVVKGGLSVAGPFIVHLMILWVQHVRTGKTLSEARADLELRWQSIGDALLTALGVLADHLTHPVVAARAFSWWRLYRGSSYSTAWKTAAAQKMAKQQQHARALAAKAAEPAKSDGKRGDGERRASGEEAADVEPSVSKSSASEEPADVVPATANEPEPDPDRPPLPQRHAQLTPEDVEASFAALVREMTEAAEEQSGSEAGTSESEPEPGTAETEPADVGTGTVESEPRNPELVPIEGRNLGTSESEPEPVGTSEPELVGTTEPEPRNSDRNSDRNLSEPRNSGTRNLGTGRHQAVGTSEPGTTSTRNRNRNHAAAELDTAEPRNSEPQASEPRNGEAERHLSPEELAVAQSSNVTAALRLYFDRLWAAGVDPEGVSRAALGKELGCSARNVSKALKGWQQQNGQ